jgi:hypothetical protein
MFDIRTTSENVAAAQGGLPGERVLTYARVEPLAPPTQAASSPRPVTAAKAKPAANPPIHERVGKTADMIDTVAQGVTHSAARVARRTGSSAVSGADRGADLLRRAPRSAIGGVDDAAAGVEALHVARLGRNASRLGAAGRGASRVAVPVAVAASVLDVGLTLRSEGRVGPRTEHAIGRSVGGMGGAYVGAIVGTALIPIPGVGTFVGATVGGLAGSYAGDALAGPAADIVRGHIYVYRHVADAAVDAAEGVARGTVGAAKRAAGFVGGLFH